MLAKVKKISLNLDIGFCKCNEIDYSLDLVMTWSFNSNIGGMAAFKNDRFIEMYLYKNTTVKSEAIVFWTIVTYHITLQK